jgi:hypothetical protein
VFRTAHTARTASPPALLFLAIPLLAAMACGGASTGAKTHDGGAEKDAPMRDSGTRRDEGGSSKDAATDRRAPPVDAACPGSPPACATRDSDGCCDVTRTSSAVCSGGAWLCSGQPLPGCRNCFPQPSGASGCTPACGGGSVCVETYPYPNGPARPLDSGACQAGELAYESGCLPDPTFTCAPDPCKGPLDCSCAQSACGFYGVCIETTAATITCAGIMP